MTGEIENYLLEKLDQAIKDTQSMDQHLYTKLFNSNKDLLKLRALLQPNSTSTPVIDESKRREILYLLNNALTEWQLISKKPSFYSPEVLVFACKLRQKLKEIKRDLKGKEGSRAGEGLTGITSNAGGSGISANNLDVYRCSSRTIDRSKVHGFEDKERFLERLLLRKESKEGFKAIAIVGMLGIGKTTLCQLIFNNQNVKQQFLPRIWVCMSRQLEEDENNEKEIVKRMLSCLGVEDEIIDAAAGEDPNLALQKLMFALRLQLMGKKYLIVLDDAWNAENKHFENLGISEKSNYNRLAYGLPKGHGGTVIISTRYEEIAEKMVGEENVHRLLPMMDRESCWKIFMDAVEKDGKKYPENLNELKDMIVDKCEGLPLTAKMMGEIMNQKLQSNPVSSKSHSIQQAVQPKV